MTGFDKSMGQLHNTVCEHSMEFMKVLIPVVISGFSFFLSASRRDTRIGRQRVWCCQLMSPPDYTSDHLQLLLRHAESSHFSQTESKNQRYADGKPNRSWQLRTSLIQSLLSSPSAVPHSLGLSTLLYSIPSTTLVFGNMHYPSPYFS